MFVSVTVRRQFLIPVFAFALSAAHVSAVWGDPTVRVVATTTAASWLGCASMIVCLFGGRPFV
jgi:hypothetical protein